MGRRSDHSRAELREIIISEGHRQMHEVGFARFSAREVAKRIGYSIGTIYNVFGSYDGLILAINGRTLELWRDYLESQAGRRVGDRLRHAIDAYFEFAIVHRHAWAALYDFRLPDDIEPPEDYQRKVTAHHRHRGARGRRRAARRAGCRGRAAGPLLAGDGARPLLFHHQRHLPHAGRDRSARRCAGSRKGRAALTAHRMN